MSDFPSKFLSPWQVVSRILYLLAAFCLFSSESFAQWDGGFYDDAAPQYDEQGYLLGSSYSNHGSVNINNFNGNLLYRKSLYSFKGEGGMDLNIALTYNGSTPHYIVGRLRGKLLSEHSNLVNINAPAWILSVNGIGIQVFNFENSLHSWTAGPPHASKRDSVSLLVSGYHLNVTQFNTPVRSTLSLLLEDGTTDLLIDVDENPSGLDDGLSQSDGKTAFNKLWSEFHAAAVHYKEFWVKRGDGTTIYGKTFKSEYIGGYQEPCEMSHFSLNFTDTLGVFIPDSIYDNSGNVITFEYQFTYSLGGNPNQKIYAHPLISRITLNHDSARSINVSYTLSEDTVKNIIVGDYTLDVRSRPDTNIFPTLNGEANRCYITKITDPENRTTFFSYERYVRAIENYYYRSGKNWTGFFCNYTIITADHLYPDLFRISEIKDHTGGISKFKYYESDNSDSLTLNYAGSFATYVTASPAVRFSAYFDVIGRDAFFNNMVTSHSIYSRISLREQLIAKDSFLYSWDNINNFSLIEYEGLDTFYTQIYRDSSENPVPNGSSSRYKYIMHPYSRYGSAITYDPWALSWNFSLIEQANEYDTTTFTYDIGFCDDIPPDGPGCDGTFNLLTKTINKNGITTVFEYGYGAAIDGFNFEFDTTKSPLGTNTVTEIKTNYLNVTSGNSLYINKNQSSLKIFNALSQQLLAEKRYEFYMDSTSEGNRGQLREIIDYLIENGSRSDSNKTLLSYHHNAQEGYGNLKKVVMPNGDSVKLYYYLPDTVIGTDTFNLTYNAVDKDGVSTVCRERVPIYKGNSSHIEKYMNGGILSSYRSYNKFGAVNRIVNFHGDVSIYDYDNIVRIKQMTFPYGFDSVLTGSNSTVIRNNLFGFDTEYLYKDIAFDDAYNTITIGNRLYRDTFVVIPETTFTYADVIRSANANQQGSETISDTISVDSSLEYWLVLPANCLGDSHARIKKNGVIIHEIVCQPFEQNIYDSFSVFFGDIIVAEVEHVSPIPGNYSARFKHYDKIIQSIAPDTFYTIDVTIKSEFDGKRRKIKTSFLSMDRSYDFVSSDYNHFDKPKTIRDQLSFETDYNYDKISRTVKTTYSDPAASSDTTAYGALSFTDLPSSVTQHSTLTDQFLFQTTNINENGDSLLLYHDAEKQLRFSGRRLVNDTLWTIYDYDKLGNLTKVRRPAGDEVHYRYNSLGQLTKEWAAEYDTVFYRYDKNGNTALRRDGNLTDIGVGNTTHWEYRRYDGLNRLTESGQIEITGLDTTGRTPIVKLFYDQNSSSYSKGRLSCNISNENGYKYGERYDYDARGRITKQVNYFEAGLDSTLVGNGYEYYLTGDSFVVQFTYTAGEEIESITYPDGMVVTYTYDDRGRIWKVGDNVDQAKYATFSYTKRNKIEQMILGNSTQIVDYDYNERGWLKTINDGQAIGGDVFGEHLYYYDDSLLTSPPQYYFNGNIIGQKVDIDGDVSQRRFKYDDLDRLTDVKLLDIFLFDEETFTYDDNGNRLIYLSDSLLVRHDTLNYHYIVGTNILDSISGTLYGTYNNKLTYDKNGNLTFNQQKDDYFDYDIYNQLDTVTFPNLSTPDLYLAFGYNVDGERVFKDYRRWWTDFCNDPPPPAPLNSSSGPGGGGTSTSSLGPGGGGQICTYSSHTYTYYIRSKGQVLAEYGSLSPTANPINKYIYAGGQRIAMRTSSNKLHYYLSDHLGSAGVVIDSTGTIKDKYKYRSFGQTYYEVTNTGQNYKFTGKPFDTEESLDLYYFGARYYDPTLGRFTAVDPSHSSSPDWSPFLYTLDNPLVFVDPDGEKRYRVIIDAYIPAERFLIYGYGDNRGPEVDGATSRIRHEVYIETDKSISSDVILPNLEKRTAGASRFGIPITNLPLIDIIPVPLPDITIVFSVKNDNKGINPASGTRSADINNGDNAIITFTGSKGSAALGQLGDFTSIDYEFTITIDPSAGTATISGSHTGFPAFTIWVIDDQGNYQVYQHNVERNDSYKLFLGKNVKVDENRELVQKRPIPKPENFGE